MRQGPLRDLLALMRPRIGLLAAAGAATGYLACGGATGVASAADAAIAVGPDRLAGISLAAAGAWLLSAGASALNQVQERRPDAHMERTKSRPLPSGRMGVGAALALSLCCLGLAAAALAASPGGRTAALFVPLVLLVYNGIYTPLKTRSSLAMLAGGLAGALPPALGFAAAGGDPLGAPALLLAGVFYAWQVPHFWLFAQRHAGDYARAGFVAPQRGVAPQRAQAALRLWILGYAGAMLLIPAFGLLADPLLRALVGGLALLLCPAAMFLPGRPRLGFALVNLSLALFLCFLAADALRLAA